MEQTTDLIEALLRQPPYALDGGEKVKRLIPAVQAALEHHYEHCPAFKTLCEKRGFNPHHGVNDLSEVPYLPAQLFKQMMLTSTDGDGSLVTLRSSATRSGIPSRIVVDALTARRQKRTVASILSSYLGPERLPFVVCDADPSALGETSARLTARGAAIRGFLLASSGVDYVMTADADGRLHLDANLLRAVLDRVGCGGRIRLFGFTAILHQAVTQLQQQGVRLSLPDAMVLHIGGWKRLQERAVTKEAFTALLVEVLGVSPSRVIDVYGFTEQIGMIYPDCEQGVKHTPVFAEVIVRDPRTLQPADDGQEGLLQFIFPIPHSYPGVSVITDDVGKILSRAPCGCGRNGTSFVVLGRAPAAEPRGCGDLMPEHMAVGSA